MRASKIPNSEITSGGGENEFPTILSWTSFLASPTQGNDQKPVFWRRLRRFLPPQTAESGKEFFPPRSSLRQCSKIILDEERALICVISENHLHRSLESGYRQEFKCCACNSRAKAVRQFPRLWSPGGSECLPGNKKLGGESVRFGVTAGAAIIMTPSSELCRREDAEKLFIE